MLGIFKKKKAQPIKVEKPPEKKINFSTLLDLIQNGDQIGLKIQNRDNSDSMNRMLALDGVEIDLSEWTEWTLRIRLVNGNDSLTVYETSNLKIKWYQNSISWADFSNKPLEVEWTEHGNWCTGITNTIEKLKKQLDVKRQQDIEEKVRKIAREKEYEAQKIIKFNDIYKSK